MRPITVVITDLDDTLWDWVGIWYKSFKAMLDQLELDSGIARDVLIKDFKSVFEKHGTTEYAFAIEELPSLQEKHKGEDFTVIYKDAIKAYRSARAMTLCVYPTVLESLQHLKSKGVLLVGYTESMSFYTRYRLRKLGLDQILNYLYSPMDHELPKGLSPDKIRYYPPERYNLRRTIQRFTPAEKHKPSPDVLRAILDDIGAEPEQVIYVGDKLHKDIVMAQNAGVVDVWAKYGEAKDRKEYELLRQVTHWSYDAVKKERETTTENVSPKYILEHSFSELLGYFEFAPFVDTSQDKKLSFVVETWKKTIDVQQHFNNIEIKIRNFAVTILIAAIAASGYALKEKFEFQLFGLKIPLASIIMFSGVFWLIPLWFMDRHWYHRLLYGAVEHSRTIEQRHMWHLPEIGLSEKIKEESPTKFLRWNLHSKGKLNLFYGIIAFILVAGGVATLFCKPTLPEKPVGTEQTAPLENQSPSVSDPCSVESSASR